MDPCASSIERGLRRIRIRRWLSWGLFAGWLPFGISVSKLTTSSAVETTAMLTYMAIATITGAVVGFSTCPRCKLYFFMGTYTNTFSSRCLNCGLPLSGD